MVEKGEKKTPESHPNPYETIGHSVYAHERREDIFRSGEMMSQEKVIAISRRTSHTLVAI